MVFKYYIRAFGEEDLNQHFNGRQPLMEDTNWWKIFFDEREPLIWWKKTFDGRKSLMEDNLRRKMTFEGGLCLKKFWDSALPYTVIAVILKKIIFFNRSNTHFIQKKWLCVNRTALWASSSYARVSLESFFQSNPMRFSINVILDPKCLSH